MTINNFEVARVDGFESVTIYEKYTLSGMFKVCGGIIIRSHSPEELDTTMIRFTDKFSGAKVVQTHNVNVRVDMNGELAYGKPLNGEFMLLVQVPEGETQYRITGNNLNRSPQL